MASKKLGRTSDNYLCEAEKQMESNYKEQPSDHYFVSIAL